MSKDDAETQDLINDLDSIVIEKEPPAKTPPTQTPVATQQPAPPSIKEQPPQTFVESKAPNEKAFSIVIDKDFSLASLDTKIQEEGERVKQERIKQIYSRILENVFSSKEQLALPSSLSRYVEANEDALRQIEISLMNMDLPVERRNELLKVKSKLTGQSFVPEMSNYENSKAPMKNGTPVIDVKAKNDKLDIDSKKYMAKLYLAAFGVSLISGLLIIYSLSMMHLL